MAKRIFKRDMDSYDDRNDESNVRELEMLVDSCFRDQGYVIQFWRDMDTYGLHEAILYLQNNPNKGGADLERVLDFERVFTQKYRAASNAKNSAKYHGACAKSEDEWD